jgi:poly-gamma-glutamate synthesis protein (capsule biosynthesis protein)
MASEESDATLARRQACCRSRRGFLAAAGTLALAGLNPVSTASPTADRTLFLCGDVMTGRGIDQILPHAGDPVLHESWMRSARGYVALAEGETGQLPRAAAFDYVWGDALAELERVQPHARVVNLETAVTTASDPWPDKGIHYRMHPANLPCLTVAGLDCVSLANNHVLDWGRHGLVETLRTLHAAGIRTAGAGAAAEAARAPATIALGAGRRLLVYACATTDSGVPPDWAAGPGRPGVCVLPDLAKDRVARIATRIDAERRPGDLVLLSIHWGGNWGYHVSNAMRQFARSVIDLASVDLVHGHSSHHPLGIEVHRERLILYGCGDFLNDYEGIGGHEQFRPALTLMYFPRLDANGRLRALELVPMKIRHFRVNRASAEESAWLASMLNREGAAFGTRVEPGRNGSLELRWD